MTAQPFTAAPRDVRLATSHRFSSTSGRGAACAGRGARRAGGHPRYRHAHVRSGSTYEVEAELDWDYMARIDKFFGRLYASMDGGVLPYDFAARGQDLKAAVDADELEAAGVSHSAANQLASQTSKLARKGATWNSHRTAIKSGDRAKANDFLLRGVKTSLKGYQALDAWDYSCYPHQQTMWDIEYMDAALAHLEADPVEGDAAIEDLGSVGINWYNSLFTPSVVDYELTRHDPDYYRVTWGAMGKQIDQFQMAPVWALIGAGQYDKAIAKVQKFRDADALDLRMRVQDMITVTSKVNDRLDQLNKLK